jgi:outer membrane protein insertion porin family
MLKIYKAFFLIGIALITKTTVHAQVTDSIPVSVDVELEQLLNAKTPKQYVIADIKVTGTQSFDAGLITSISGLAVGDKVMLPGADNFSRAIANLWKQNLISNVEIYFDKLVGNNLYIEISITERPRLTNFKYKG